MYFPLLAYIKIVTKFWIQNSPTCPKVDSVTFNGSSRLTTNDVNAFNNQNFFEIAQLATVIVKKRSDF
jgi:hypothetical protein